MQLNKHRAAVFTTVQLLCEARTDIDKEFNDGATDIDNEFNEWRNTLLVASLRRHADVHNSFVGRKLIVTRSLTIVQHLCLWHLCADTQMSHNSCAEHELILTSRLTMAQHLFLWHLSADMLMSHNSFAECELILTKRLTMVQQILRRVQHRSSGSKNQ